jgi:crotonobetainyl-CoA:carnitine CoA-transferase CaiB-like acyl-CoA transferase
VPTAPPLDGIVVADFSRVLAAPLATMNLADLGATVIKVETPDRGDDTRSWGPPWAAHNSSYFESVNRSKQSVCLDLAEPGDQALAHELVRRADVVIENFLPGKLERFGLDASQTRVLNPRVVHCSVTGFGRHGGAELPGYDFVIQALGGLMSITGEASGEPTKVGVAIVDVLTGKDAVIGIMAALRAREADGQGQHVEVNLLSSLLGSLANQASAFLTTGQAPRRMGNEHPSIAPYETLRCSDGWIAVACGNDRQFRALVEELGLPSLADDVRFLSNSDRVLHRTDLVPLLEAALSVAPAGQWQTRLTAAAVPAGCVQDIAAAFDLADALGLHMRVPMPDDYADQVAHPVTYSGFVPRAPEPPPRHGQHDHEVRRWLSNSTATPLSTTHTVEEHA